MLDKHLNKAIKLVILKGSLIPNNSPKTENTTF